MDFAVLGFFVALTLLLTECQRYELLTTRNVQLRLQHLTVTVADGDEN